MPAHACRCTANLLANEQRITSAQLAAVPRSAVWEPLLAAWIATATQAAATGAASTKAERESAEASAEFISACTGVLVSLLQRSPALAASVVANDGEIGAILRIAGPSLSLSFSLFVDKATDKLSYVDTVCLSSSLSTCF
eukprot:COSAG03_NODE_3160_length_2172_cov_7.918958_1_plen_139_part_10